MVEVHRARRPSEIRRQVGIRQADSSRVAGGDDADHRHVVDGVVGSEAKFPRQGARQLEFRLAVTAQHEAGADRLVQSRRRRAHHQFSQRRVDPPDPIRGDVDVVLVIGAPLPQIVVDRRISVLFGGRGDNSRRCGGGDRPLDVVHAVPDVLPDRRPRDGAGFPVQQLGSVGTVLRRQRLEQTQLLREYAPVGPAQGREQVRGGGRHGQNQQRRQSRKIFVSIVFVANEKFC